MMEPLSGKISDKLRKMFTSDELKTDPHPDRSKSPKKKPIPKGVSGQKMTGRKKK